MTQAFRPNATPRRSIESRLGLPAKDAPQAPGSVKRSHRVFARLAGAVLEPTWYWLDLYGPDDHPSNTKVVATAAIFTGLLLIAAIGIGLAVKGVQPDVEYYGFASFIIAGAAAWDAQKTRTKTRAAVDVIRSGVTMTTEQTSTTTTTPAPAPGAPA